MVRSCAGVPQTPEPFRVSRSCGVPAQTHAARRRVHCRVMRQGRLVLPPASAHGDDKLCLVLAAQGFASPAVGVATRAAHRGSTTRYDGCPAAAADAGVHSRANPEAKAAPSSASVVARRYRPLRHRPRRHHSGYNPATTVCPAAAATAAFTAVRMPRRMGGHSMATSRSRVGTDRFGTAPSARSGVPNRLTTGCRRLLPTAGVHSRRESRGEWRGHSSGPTRS